MTTSMCYFYVLKKKKKSKIYYKFMNDIDTVCMCVCILDVWINFAFKDICFINGILERSNINNCHGIDRSFILMPSEPRQLYQGEKGFKTKNNPLLEAV